MLEGVSSLGSHRPSSLGQRALLTIDSQHPTNKAYPPKKVLGSRFSTPYSPFVWICIISSELTCISHLYPFEWAGVDIRWFSVDGIDIRWIPSSFLCGVVDMGFRNLLKAIIAMKFIDYARTAMDLEWVMPGHVWIWNELCTRMVLEWVMPGHV